MQENMYKLLTSQKWKYKDILLILKTEDLK